MLQLLKQSMILLYRVSPCQEQLHLQILHQLEEILQKKENLMY